MTLATRILLLMLALELSVRAEETFPRPDWHDAPNPLASPHAVVGGTLSIFPGPYPPSFNYYLNNSAFSAEIFSSLYETLITTSPLTADYEPALAQKWTISDDKRTFTFWIDPKARWSDGQPVTAEDVLWTFDTIMDPKNLTGGHKVPLQSFERPVILTNNVIRFTSKEVHWRNLAAAGEFHILPRHAFTNQDFNKINFAFPVVSGPYQLGELKEGIQLKLERRADWWARAYLRNQHTGNFQTLQFRFFAEQENAYEAFKKGQIDLFPVYMARLWVNETQGDRFSRNWIVKQRVENHRPVGFQGFAMNMRRPPFHDLNVRRALCHLVDRDRMNTTLMYSQYFLHRSYFEDLYDAQTPCTNPPYAFDKEAARALLHQAGWTANPATGLLEKDGQPLTVRFLTHDSSSDKFLAIFSEDLKDVGITLTVDKKDAAAWSKDMDEFNYDITWAAWSAGLFKDPEDMWSSKEADRHSGNNITGFKDPRVDELIEKQKPLFDLQGRNAIVREIDGILTAQCPYILLWNINATRLLYWNKFGMPPTVLGKYGGERDAYWYWWYDSDSAAELEEAQQSGAVLPERPPLVQFDKVFPAPVTSP
ncbi:MAG: extracellular solute-binding protein [Lentisphaerae bacterium]|nr:extracellular solute-binding protein [Lentisphaerota bacterium]